MTPSARLAAAVDILGTLDLARPVEPQLKTWARGNRYAGSKDRRAIADRVYTVLRRWRSCAVLGGGEGARARVLGSLISADGMSVAAIEALCTGGYGLAALNDDERATLSRAPDWPGTAAELDWPDWLWNAAKDVFGDETRRELDALRQRAPIDLRVNTLKTTTDEAIVALHRDGLDAERTGSPDANALRLPAGSPVLASDAWKTGMVELQDVGSQAVATLTDARPGETVLDFCAGGGGKTLALAASMANEGRLLAHDIDPSRMADLPQRAHRAGVTCLSRPNRDTLDTFVGRCDRVLVDAPCSGSGSWRRDPVGKWRLTPAGLTALTTMQDSALDAAARYVRRGGALTYATCSILAAENEARIDAFLARNPSFEKVDTRRMHPARDACDGFFVARLTLTTC